MTGRVSLVTGLLPAPNHFHLRSDILHVYLLRSLKNHYLKSHGLTNLYFKMQITSRIIMGLSVIQALMRIHSIECFLSSKVISIEGLRNVGRGQKLGELPEVSDKTNRY